MSKGSYVPNSIDRARDELFSHIRRCGVLEAEADQRHEWFDDTIQYIGERYPELTPGELTSLRTIGERYCGPAIPHGSNDGDAAEEEAAPEAEAEDAPSVESVAETTVEPVSEVVSTPAPEADAEAVPEAEVEDEDVVDTGEVSAA